MCGVSPQGNLGQSTHYLLTLPPYIAPVRDICQGREMKITMNCSVFVYEEGFLNDEVGVIAIKWIFEEVAYDEVSILFPLKKRKKLPLKVPNNLLLSLRQITAQLNIEHL